MDIFDDTITPPASNQPEFTVSELSGAVKRVIEGEFGLVRVRGEVGRLSRPASGHVYFDLKDDRSVIAAISWKGQVAKMQTRPEEGMEVIATGRLTTFPGQSKYQLIVEDIAPAGAGALMAMLERRRAMLAGEGLFDAARKQALPYLPGVIGVVTSPSGAVIRDILHRLRDRLPRHVLIWPVAVQGQACAGDVAAAIAGFNAIAAGGAIARPDLIIVARGGGSLEDLWGFNEEIVVRAAAASRIPLISAVGHETDTTLLDFAADMRAPTPTAAAEMAVPVRADLLAGLDGMAARQSRAVAAAGAARGQRLRDLARALPRIELLLERPSQRFDVAVQRLGGALGMAAARKRSAFGSVAGRLRADILRGVLTRKSGALALLRLDDALARGDARRSAAFDKWGSRLAPALARLVADGARGVADGRGKLALLGARLAAAPAARFAALTAQLEGLERMRVTLGYTETLARGYAVVRADGAVVSSRKGAEAASSVEIEFADGRVALGGKPKKAGVTPPSPAPLNQGSLF